MRVIPLTLVFEDGTAGPLTSIAQAIHMYQGEDIELDLTCVKPDHTEDVPSYFDIANLVGGITVRKFVGSTVVEFANAFVIVNIPTGRAKITINDSDTGTKNARVYRCDIRLSDTVTEDDWIPLPNSPLVLLPAVTLPTTAFNQSGPAMSLVGLPAPTVDDIGKFLKLADNSPFLTEWAEGSGGSGSGIVPIASASELPDATTVPDTIYRTADTNYLWFSDGANWNRVGPPPVTQFSQAFSALPDPSVAYSQAYKVFGNNAVYESAFNVWRQIGALSPTAVKTTDYVALANERVAVNLSGGAFSITLPKATTCPAATVVVKKTVDSANTLTILPDATLPDTVEGGSSFDVTGGGKQSITLYSDGVSNWEII